MPWKFDFPHPEVTFLLLGKQLVVSQGLKNGPQVISMLLSGLGLNQSIINEHHDKMIQVRPKDSVHEIHKSY